MPRIKFHKVAAIAVLIGTVAWVATGEFSSVGSAAGEDPAAAAKKPAEEQQVSTPLRTVGVLKPIRIEHSRAIRMSGYTDADQRAVLAARTAGVIEELPVKLGDRVNRGDIILKLEAEGKEAAVEAARQTLKQRETEAEAAQKLHKQGSVSKQQLDTAMSALALARSGLEAAEAELNRNIVRAPFPGTIDKIDVELGTAVQVGAPVATILNLDPILARGEVSERDLGFVEPGDKAEVRLVNGMQVEGELRHVSRDATTTTRTFRVEIAIPNPDGKVPSGMTAEITLRADPVPATILPRSVVTLSADGDLGIRAVDANNKVVFFPIDLVDDTPHGLVLAGIPDDVRIIVAGQEMISEGDTVNPVDADPETIKKLAEVAAGGTL